MKWGANLMGALATAIPQIALLTMTEEQRAAASAKSAAFAAMASEMSIPIVGPALGMAAMAAVVAAMLSVPKFANGGIVPGGLTVGDKVWTRLNSGELILNKAQQSNIASQLSNPANRIDVQVTGKVSGRDLLFAIDKNRRHYSRT